MLSNDLHKKHLILQETLRDPDTKYLIKLSSQEKTLFLNETLLNLEKKKKNRERYDISLSSLDNNNNYDWKYIDNKYVLVNSKTNKVKIVKKIKTIICDFDREGYLKKYPYEINPSYKIQYMLQKYKNELN